MKALRYVPALALAAGLGGTAHAQTPPSADQAKSLEKQIHDTLTALSGGLLPIPARPVEMKPDGDHYLVRVPFSQFGPLKIEPKDAAFTAQAKMLDANRWSLDNQQFPSELKLATKMMVPDAADAKNPSPDGKHAETVVYTLKLGQQDAHGIFDPTFATATTSQGTIASVDLLAAGDTQAGVTHMGKLSTQSSMRPIDPAHVDLLTDTTTENYATESALPDGTTVKMTASNLHVVGALNGLAHDKLLPIIHAIAEAAKIPQNSSDPKVQAADKAAGKQLLNLAKGLLTGGRIDESATDVKFTVGDHAGALSKVEMSFGGDAPQDMLSATMSFSLDGLVVNDLPPALAAYMPKHLGLRPTLSNLSVKDLTKMGMDAIDADDQPPPQDIEALFSHGGINVGFDSLGLDIAGTQFAGSGKFTVTGPQTVNGQAEITAHDLDGLISKAQGDPMLAQGMPVIIFLKGIAHTNGDQAVWQISVANKKVLVNGVDLSAMAGAMK